METSVLQRSDQPHSRLAPGAMAFGGVLALVGSLLTWASVQVAGPVGGAQRSVAKTRRPGRTGRSFDLTGLNTTAGRAVLALSIALIVVALLAFVAYWFWLRLGAITVGLVLGVIALVWSALDLASPASAFGVGRVRLARRAIPVSAGIGVYMAVAGSAVAVIAAAAWLVLNRGRWATFATMGGAPAPARPESGPDKQPTTPLPPTTSPGLAPD
ncbi:MAG TPA: hypothetical protein VF986_02025 [Actinomycetota bacterium]